MDKYPDFFVSEIVEKSSKGSRIFTFIIIGAVIYCINLFSIFYYKPFYESSRDAYIITTSGERYTADVIGYKKENDKSIKKKSTFYTPIVRFTTKKGEIIERELKGYRTTNTEEETYEVNYNSERNTVIPVGFIFMAQTAGVFILGIILFLLFISLMLFCFGFQMDRWTNCVVYIVFVFFVPLVMIVLEGFLIHSLFYGNPMPSKVYILVIFFVFILGMSILGYIRFLFTEFLFNGKKKKKEKKKKQKNKSKAQNIEFY